MGAIDEVEAKVETEERRVKALKPVLRTDWEAAGRSLFKTPPALPEPVGGRTAPGGGRWTPLTTGLGATGTFFGLAGAAGTESGEIAPDLEVLRLLLALVALTLERLLEAEVTVLVLVTLEIELRS